MTRRRNRKINHKTKEVKTGICSYHLCNKKTEVRNCKYCEETFCKEHIKAKPPAMPNFEGSLKQKITEEWDKHGGHPCIPYYDYWKIEQEKISKEYSEALDRLIKSAPIEKQAQDELTREHVHTQKDKEKGYGESLNTILGPKAIHGEKYTKPYYYSKRRKRVKGFLVLFALLSGAIIIYFILSSVQLSVNDDNQPSTWKPLILISRCSDGTVFGMCSIVKPLYCENGTLVSKTSRCGCPQYRTPTWVNNPPTWSLSTSTMFNNPKWYTNHLTFTFPKNCTKLQRDKMIDAMNYIVNNTRTSLTFTEVADGCSDIIITCLNVSDMLEDTIGTAQPSYFDEGYYSVITKSEIELTLGDQLCPLPNMQIHELMHSFGFDHSKDPSDIMYEKFGCAQTMKDSLKKNLEQIYPL